MPEKCDKNIKVVIHLCDAACEFSGKNIREVINLIDDSVRFIPKLEEAIDNFIFKYQEIYHATAEEKDVEKIDAAIEDAMSKWKTSFEPLTS